MKKTHFTVLVSCTILFVVSAFAQRGLQWRGSGGWGPGEQYGKMYDVNTVETISGEVMAVERFTARKGIADGVHLTLKTEQENITVHLGPAWFIESLDAKIEPKDQIEVTGSKISYEGTPVLVAADITRGDEVLALRSETGFPAWAGWRESRRRGPRGWGKGRAMAGAFEYDPKTVETVAGTVLEMEKHPAKMGNFYGIHLKFKTEKEEIEVHLGPQWYVSSQKVAIEKDDKIEVTGSRIMRDGKAAILAKEIKKGEEVLKLRNELGIPAWSGGCCKS